jgi:hypothetical protein
VYSSEKKNNYNQCEAKTVYNEDCDLQTDRTLKKELIVIVCRINPSFILKNPQQLNH